MNDFHKMLMKYAAFGLAGVLLVAFLDMQRENSSSGLGLILVIALPVLIGVIGGITGAVPGVKSAEQRSRDRKAKEQGLDEE